MCDHTKDCFEGFLLYNPVAIHKKPLQRVAKGNVIIDIYPDSFSPESPRDWDNLGTMALWHGRYDLPQESPFERPAELMEEMNSDNYLWLPVYMLDHSGLAFSTSDFHDPWDSGQVGVIYVSKKRVIQEFAPDLWKKMVELRVDEAVSSSPAGEVMARAKALLEEEKRTIKELEERVLNILREEVRVFEQWANGDVYGYIAQNVKTGGATSSCWGYYDIKHAIRDAYHELKD